MSTICSTPRVIYSNYKERQKLYLLISKYEAMIDRIVFRYPDYENKENDLKNLSNDLEDLQKALELSRGILLLFWNDISCDDKLNNLFEQLLEKKNEIENTIVMQQKD